jgi:hypothetical protein
LAKSIGWITQEAAIAALPPQTNGSKVCDIVGDMCLGLCDLALKSQFFYRVYWMETLKCKFLAQCVINTREHNESSNGAGAAEGCERKFERFTSGWHNNRCSSLK